MFALWQDMAPAIGVPAVMRDVTLWAFTEEFFDTRGAELAVFEAAMATLDQSVPAYLSQLHAIQAHDATARLARLGMPCLVLAGETDILIPVALSRVAPGHSWRALGDDEGRARLPVGTSAGVQRRRPGVPGFGAGGTIMSFG